MFQSWTYDPCQILKGNDIKWIIKKDLIKPCMGEQIKGSSACSEEESGNIIKKNRNL